MEALLIQFPILILKYFILIYFLSKVSMLFWNTYVWKTYLNNSFSDLQMKSGLMSFEILQ